MDEKVSIKLLPVLVEGGKPNNVYHLVIHVSKSNMHYFSPENTTERIKNVIYEHLRSLYFTDRCSGMKKMNPDLVVA